MKRTVWILAALTVLAVGLAGCDEGETDTGAETAAAESPPAAAAEPAAEAEQPAAEPEAETEAEEAGDAPPLNCESFVDKLVELMGDQEGAFINADNRDDWVMGCRTKGDIAEHREVAECILRAETIEASRECGDTGFINRWVM